MASWLRAAEELFEVVDRTAKQVVRDRVVEESDLSPSGASEQGFLQRKSSGAPLDKNAFAKSPARFTPLLPPKGFLQMSNSGDAMTRTELKDSNSSLNSDERKVDLGDKNESGLAATNHTEDSSGTLVILDDSRDPDVYKPSTVSSEVENSETASTSQEPEKLRFESISLEPTQQQIVGSEGLQGLDNKLQAGEETQVGTYPDSSSQNLNVNQTSLLQSVSKEKGDDQLIGQTAEDGLVTSDLAVQSVPIASNGFVDKAIHEELVEIIDKTVSNNVIESSTNSVLASETGPAPEDLKVEDQIAEARSLLQNAASSGKSKEARLAKVCAGLSTRLQEYKVENSQLEKLLENEKKSRDSLEVKINQLQQELTAERASTNAIQIEMAAALSSKNSEIERLRTSADRYKKQVDLANEEVITLQAELEAVAKNRNMTETRVIQALREELNSAERRADEERAAHSATRTAAVERETQLEHQVADAISALMRMQGAVDEKTQNISDLEHKLSMLEVECATLNQQLQEKEVRTWREQRRQNEETLQNAWREESERTRKVQHDLEAKIATLEAECQKLRVELTSVKRDSEKTLVKANAEMEERLNALTEVLYLKQTQLEALASEKAAALLQLEKESKLFREVKAEAERNRLKGHPLLGYDNDNDMRSFDSLGLQQHRIASPSIQTAAKFLDSGIVSAGRFLWRRPLARIFLLFYLVFVHFFLMYLLHRLQEQVDQNILSKEEMEAAVAAGFVQHGF